MQPIQGHEATTRVDAGNPLVLRSLQLSEKGRGMIELSAALDKLQAALVTLESAAEARLGVGNASAQADALIKEMRAERDGLASELEAVRAEAAALEEVTDEVSGRLDGAIAGIRDVLEG